MAEPTIANGRLTVTGHALASHQVKALLEGVQQIRLGYLCRELSRVDFNRFQQEAKDLGSTEAAQGPLGCAVSARLVAGLLRIHGFHKTGSAGSGYNREPVYSRRPITGSDIPF